MILEVGLPLHMLNAGFMDGSLEEGVFSVFLTICHLVLGSVEGGPGPFGPLPSNDYSLGGS